MCRVVDLSKTLGYLKFPIGRLREIVDQNRFQTPEECADFFTVLFQSNLAGFFFRSLENFPRYHDYIYGPDAFMRVEGFCEEISQYTTFQTSPARVRAPLPFADLRFPHVVLAHAVTAFRAQITKQWIVLPNAENSMDQRSEWLFPVVMIMASVVWLIRYGDPRGFGGRFSAIASQITAVRPYLTPPLQEIIDKAENMDPERAPIEIIVKFLVNRALPTLLIAILLSDRARTEAKITEYVLSVAEIVKLGSCFQPGVLSDRSLTVELWGHLSRLFPLQEA
jgi:hypothetical protein